MRSQRDWVGTRAERQAECGCQGPLACIGMYVVAAEMLVCSMAFAAAQANAAWTFGAALASPGDASLVGASFVAGCCLRWVLPVLLLVSRGTGRSRSLLAIGTWVVLTCMQLLASYCAPNISSFGDLADVFRLLRFSAKEGEICIRLAFVLTLEVGLPGSLFFLWLAIRSLRAEFSAQQMVCFGSNVETPLNAGASSPNCRSAGSNHVEQSRPAVPGSGVELLSPPETFTGAPVRSCELNIQATDIRVRCSRAQLRSAIERYIATMNVLPRRAEVHPGPQWPRAP